MNGYESKMAGSNSYRDTQLDGLVHTHSAGWGTGTFYGNWKQDTPVPGTWAPKPIAPTPNRVKWNRELSIQHANSKNPAARAIGMRRDRQRGYHSCPAGRHWGPWGAAGVLAYTVDEHGRIYVAMSHRSAGVQEGNTWSTFGGAIERGEDAYEAAARETREEVDGLVFDGRDVVAEVTMDCPHVCGWSYTTFVVRVPMYAHEHGLRLPRLGAVKRPGDGKSASYYSWETQGYAWVPIAQVQARKLHSGFASTWGHNRRVIESAERIAELRAES